MKHEEQSAVEHHVNKFIDAKYEEAFEASIVDSLVASGWVHDADNTGWDIQRALYVPDVLHWLQTQFPDEFEKAVPSSLQDAGRNVAVQKLLDRLDEMLSKQHTLTAKTKQVKNGLLGTLRHGFSHSQRGRQKATFKDMVASTRKTRCTRTSSSAHSRTFSVSCARCRSTPQPSTRRSILFCWSTVFRLSRWS